LMLFSILSRKRFRIQLEKRGKRVRCIIIIIIIIIITIIAVLGFQLRAYTLSHSTSPFFVMVFFQDRVL
jgi:hypothetical protein